MTVSGDDNCYTSRNGCPTDAGDKGVKLAGTDTQCIGLTSNTRGPYIDITITCSKSTTGTAAQPDVGRARVVLKRGKANGNVIVAIRVGKQCASPHRDISVPCDI